MATLGFFIWVFLAGVPKLIQARQFYDETSCSSHTISQGSRYRCSSSSLNSCKTFIVYRSQPRFQTVSSIAELFGVSQTVVLDLNNLESPLKALENGMDILVPINCSCSGQYFESNFSYTVPANLTHHEIACGVFEGLMKTHTLLKLNPYPKDQLKKGDKLTVPVKCACPDNLSTKYLVTYPLIRGDGTKKMGIKFNISLSELWAANNLQPIPTVYPHTTLLVPLNRTPHIYPVPVTPTLDFIPITNRTETRTSKNKPIYIPIVTSVVFFVVLVLVGGGIYLKFKWKKKLNSSSARSSHMSSVSPDLLKKMSTLKYSLFSYTLEELRNVTGDFSEEKKIGNLVYKARLDGSEIVIKQVSAEDADRVIGIHSKINHTSMVRLVGVCYEQLDSTQCYLVFEFAGNGCLRDCLSDRSTVLQWRKRMQIAFDVAIGLHYIHHCTVPSYTHMNINDKNILVTEDWRGKIANLGSANDTESSKRWVAPEYFLHGLVSSKVDIFSFGVVLLELLSGREPGNVSLSKDSLGFLGGRGCEINCVEKLRDFMDPCLKEDYPVGEALCLGILAKACLEDDPSHRPTMDNILKLLARMV